MDCKKQPFLLDMSFVVALSWQLVPSYDDAAPHQNCIYVFIRDSKPVYIGRASHFGTRYSPGYSFLISALADAGHQIYIAPIPRELRHRISDIEGELISTFSPRYNKRKPAFTPLP